MEVNFKVWLENEEAKEQITPNHIKRWVNESDYDVILDSIEQLNKLAKKLDFPPIEFKVLEKKVENNNPKLLIYINGEVPRVGHHQLVAKITPVHDSQTGKTQNIISAAPGMTVPQQYMSGYQGQCDHCCTSRRRNETFLLKDERDGKYVVVGRQCLADFLRKDDLGAHIKWMEILDTLEKQESFGGGYRGDVAPVDEFLKIAYALTKIYGFKPTSSENGSTVSSTYYLINPPIASSAEDRKNWHDIWDKIRPTYESTTDEKIKDLLKWVRESAAKDPSSQYLHNLFAATLKPSVERGTAGLLASLPYALFKYEDKLAKEAQPKKEFEVAKEPTWKVGDKIDFTGKVIIAGSFDSGYGTTHIYTFKDTEGHLIKWFTGTHTFEKGQDVSVKKVTVKEIKPDDYLKGQIVTIVKGSAATKTYEPGVEPTKEDKELEKLKWIKTPDEELLKKSYDELCDLLNLSRSVYGGSLSERVKLSASKYNNLMNFIHKLEHTTMKEKAWAQEKTPEEWTSLAREIIEKSNMEESELYKLGNCALLKYTYELEKIIDEGFEPPEYKRKEGEWQHPLSKIKEKIMKSRYYSPPKSQEDQD